MGHEKLAPVTSLFVVDDDEQALALSKRLLANEGAGHTAIIHTADYARVDRFSRALPVARVLVNVPGTHGSLGVGTGLIPSFTLGTGTAGGTSTTDAVTYTHLLNIKRVALPVIWSERRGSSPYIARRPWTPPPDYLPSVVRPCRAHTSSTSRAWGVSSHTNRDAPRFRAEGLPELKRP